MMSVKAYLTSSFSCLNAMGVPVLKCWINGIIFYISAKLYVMIH
jgi:hypothetical protein